MTNTAPETQAQTRASSTTIPRQANTPEPVPYQTGWVGWIVFGATMMMVTGAFQMIQGFAAIFKESTFVVPNQDLLITVDYNAWGWTHLIFGALVVMTGIGLLAGSGIARVIGVILVSLTMLIQFAFIPAYPFWSLTMITLSVLVLFALIAHGKEMRTV